MVEVFSASSIFTAVICALSILLMLVRPRNVPEVYWVGSGAVALVVLRLISIRVAADAVAKGSDVYFFLIGMMLLSALARDNGIFDWVASVAVHAAGESCSRLFLLIYAIGTVVTICMSNDATAIVLTPAILAAVRRSKAQPKPFLFACALIANAASFVLPISNPANLVVFHSGMPSLGRWLLSFLIPSLLSITVTFLILRWYFNQDLCLKTDVPAEKADLKPEGQLVLAGLGLVIIVLLVMSSLNRDLGLPTCIAALAITGVVSIRKKVNPLPLVKEISWGTLGLVAALFILVEALKSIGALYYVQAALRHGERLGESWESLLTAFVVAAGNNLVNNNLPLGLIMGNTLTNLHTKGLLADAVLIGVDLGPNLSVTGSLATILWLLALRREGLDISALDFLKVGIIAMPCALLAAMAGALTVHAVFPIQ